MQVTAIKRMQAKDDAHMLRTSRQMRPWPSIFGWYLQWISEFLAPNNAAQPTPWPTYTGVINLAFGGSNGYLDKCCKNILEETRHVPKRNKHFDDKNTPFIT